MCARVVNWLSLYGCTTTGRRRTSISQALLGAATLRTAVHRVERAHRGQSNLRACADVGGTADARVDERVQRLGAVAGGFCGAHGMEHSAHFCRVQARAGSRKDGESTMRLGEKLIVGDRLRGGTE